MDQRSFTAPPERYGVVGQPVAHSRSPDIHALFAKQIGKSLVYDRHDVASENFARYVKDFFKSGGAGLNITVPHKEAAAELAEILTPRAAQAGAVNTLARDADGRLLGDNTDGAGLMADLDRLGVSVNQRRVLILGAGGATRGILAPLLERAPRLIVIANRNVTRAVTLSNKFAALAAGAGCSLVGADYADLDSHVDEGVFDLVVHATALGLKGEVPEISARIIDRHTFVYDLGYGTHDTPFVRWARTQGAADAAQGIGMLIEQAAESFLLWHGTRPTTGPVHATLQAELAALRAPELAGKPV